MSVIGLFAKDWDDAPLDDGEPRKPLTLKQYGITIKIAADSPASAYYEKWCSLAAEYRRQQLDACTDLILGIERK